MTLIAARSLRLSTPEGTSLAGFTERRIWNGRVWWPPEANVLVVRDEAGKGSFVTLISIDALYANEVTRRLHGKLSAEHELLVAPSHTHYVPSMSPEFPGIGVPPPGHSEAVAAQIAELVTDLCNQLNQGPRGRIRYHGAIDQTVAQRRRWALRPQAAWPLISREVMMLPTTRRPATTSARCWSVSGLEQKVILWTMPCHPTAFFDRDSVSSEYVGYVRAHLRAAFGADTVVLFLQGESGDLRQPFTSYDPRRVGAKVLATSLVPKLLPAFASPTQAEWRAWAGQLADGIVNLALRDPTRESDPSRSPEVTRASSRNVLETQPPAPALSVSWFVIDSALRILAVNAEITSDMARRLRRVLSVSADTIIATCVDECLGYIATEDEMGAGGYEGGAWLASFGCAGEVMSTAPITLLEQVAEALGALGGV